MKRHIPNMLTCCNLISGCIATYFAFEQQFDFALYFIIIGAVFDFFDGFVARLLHVSSPIGKELDSLADDITFGFAPAAIVYSMLYIHLVNWRVGEGPVPSEVARYLHYAAFVMAAFSALRLAKFNLDERQTSSFIGLPTPANALFWSSFAFATHVAHVHCFPHQFMVIFCLLGIVISSWLLVAELPMFALKFKNFSLRDNYIRYIFVLLSIVLLAVGGLTYIPFVIAAYILLALVYNLIGR